VAERLLERTTVADLSLELAADVVAIEELPDGRRLVVFSDRREIVIGVARPRPHPVAGVDWLWVRPPPSPRVRPRRSPRSTPRSTPRRSPGPDSRAAAQRAEELLCSLLDPLQRADWDANAAFWVQTPRGPVRLGHLYALVHQPDDQPDQELILCVVPHAHHELPIADVWSNLLLVLAVEPEEFFRVAILRGSRRRSAAAR
jgi:hypothetical protein